MPLASPVPIYLGCAGLIVGGLGLGAQHMLGGNSTPATVQERPLRATVQEQPFFARSVDEASLPATGWPQPNASVAHYELMVELLNTPARPAPPGAAPQPSQTAEQPQQERAAPREIVRDLSQPQTRQSRRARNQRTRDDARANEEASASTEQVDPRAARSQDRQRNAAQAEKDAPRRFDRRYRDRDEVADTRSRSDRRPREGERVVIREDVREPEQRIVRGPEQREGGFSPFRLFGIFDR